MGVLLLPAVRPGWSMFGLATGLLTPLRFIGARVRVGAVVPRGLGCAGS